MFRKPSIQHPIKRVLQGALVAMATHLVPPTLRLFVIIRSLGASSLSSQYYTTPQPLDPCTGLTFVCHVHYQRGAPTVQQGLSNENCKIVE